MEEIGSIKEITSEIHSKHKDKDSEFMELMESVNDFAKSVKKDFEIINQRYTAGYSNVIRNMDLINKCSAGIGMVFKVVDFYKANSVEISPENSLFYPANPNYKSQQLENLSQALQLFRSTRVRIESNNDMFYRLKP